MGHSYDIEDVEHVFQAVHEKAIAYQGYPNYDFAEPIKSFCKAGIVFCNAKSPENGKYVFDTYCLLLEAMDVTPQNPDLAQFNMLITELMDGVQATVSGDSEKASKCVSSALTIFGLLMPKYPSP